MRLITTLNLVLMMNILAALFLIHVGGCTEPVSKTNKETASFPSNVTGIY